ncbi:uncharacterized protein LOC124287360 [Haliotis rubra]|uniref:uncharacterized protein LOC124287360 n=1 Tax=Haliotis rubra TaxID=36100 RepID=UPI001EE50C97|nr:uncharacterized protein LOC124287360 [Haliotis rubra]XP_046579823.1 uncharacterized protein LOC124287360 [Haliotis rubra]
MPKVSRSSIKKTAEVAKSLKARPARGNGGKKKDVESTQAVLSPPTPQMFVAKLGENFKAHRNQTAAQKMKKYMRDQFAFFGLMSPIRREASKEVLSSCSGFNQAQLHQLLKLLWKEPEREYQMFGLDCSQKYIKVLCGHSADDSLKSLMVVKELITTKSWWDTVDMLAANVVGELVAAHRTSLTPVMEEWVQDENLWLRRTAILHQLNYKKKTNQELLFQYCLMCADDEDFFIRKAIGWALRNHFRTNAAAVKTFVKSNKDKLSPLSQKAALKHA